LRPVGRAPELARRGAGGSTVSAMVVLGRIYTRTGDDGTTALGDGSRVAKTDPRLVAYADVDEANSALGVVLTTPGLPSDVATLLVTVSNDLFDVGADLCTPRAAGGRPGDTHSPGPLRILPGDTARLEQAIDAYNVDLAPLRSFVLPGGTVAAAALHVARAVVRRAERSTWVAVEAWGGTVGIEPARYLNRLSDLLFVLARAVNADAGEPDVLWRPAASRR